MPKTTWSKRGITTLRYIAENGINQRMLREANSTTLNSLAQAGVINKYGVTAKGLEVLEGFDKVELVHRKHVAPITDRLARLLNLVRTQNQRERRR